MLKKTQVKYKKAPQAPRRFKSSYMFFSTEKHKLIRKELAAEKGEVCKVSTTDVAKMVSQAWKAIHIDEREEWEEKARRDKARYEMEKTMYTGPWKVPAKKIRSQKDPKAPKRPMSAFLSFSNSKRALVKSKHPDIGRNTEISRILAQMWKDASEDERKDHIDKELKLRQTYNIAIAAWRNSSELEMQAARKEREDVAMKAVLLAGTSKSASEMENSNNHMENLQSAPNSHSSNHPSSNYDGATPSYPDADAAMTRPQYSYYYTHPTHQYHYYSQGAHGETTSAPPMDPAPPSSHTAYNYEQRRPPAGYEGYHPQPYFEEGGHHDPYHPNPYGEHYAPTMIDPLYCATTTQQQRYYANSDRYGHPPYYSGKDGNAAEGPHMS